MAEPRALPGFAHWKTAACEPLTGDASARKYFRLRAGGQTAILMDASQVPDSIAPFVRIAAHLRKMGFSTPEILARDQRQASPEGHVRAALPLREASMEADTSA